MSGSGHGGTSSEKFGRRFVIDEAVHLSSVETQCGGDAFQLFFGVGFGERALLDAHDRAVRNVARLASVHDENPELFSCLAVLATESARLLWRHRIVDLPSKPHDTTSAARTQHSRAHSTTRLWRCPNSEPRAACQVLPSKSQTPLRCSMAVVSTEFEVVGEGVDVDADVRGKNVGDDLVEAIEVAEVVEEFSA